jgi:hypothetical protein
VVTGLCLVHLAVAITDTSPAARAKQDEILHAMSGEQRMTLAYGSVVL